MQIQNPILRGFNPDPSACRVGDTYYIATSTFEWWPGICIYRSSDLANWQLAAQPVKSLDFFGDESSGGLWAPHLSYADGLFYLAVTNVRTLTQFKDTLNYLLTAKQIDGVWGQPQFINASGFDPSLFHDDDGRRYFLNMLWDYRPGHQPFAGIVMQELDATTLRLKGERRLIFRGSDLGVAEGPQLLKRDGWYYLLTAAGGTEYRHAAVVARSSSVWGPYELSPHHPLVTSGPDPQNPLQKAGHACFLEADGEWYITHLCARPLTERGACVLGRETALQKIRWADGWPVLENGTAKPELLVEAPSRLPVSAQRTDNSEDTDFDCEKLPLSFQSLRGPLRDALSLHARPGWLRLYGRESISSDHEQSLLARRWQHFAFRAETALDFSPANFQEMAGLTCFYNTGNFFYAYLTRSPESGVKTFNVMVCEGKRFRMEVEELPVRDGIVLYLAVTVEREKLQFSYSCDGRNWAPLGGILPADRLSDEAVGRYQEAFTGAMVGICCQDLCDRTGYADFRYFRYRENHVRQEP